MKKIFCFEANCPSMDWTVVVHRSIVTDVRSDSEGYWFLFGQFQKLQSFQFGLLAV